MFVENRIKKLNGCVVEEKNSRKIMNKPAAFVQFVVVWRRSPKINEMR